jgi:hypothetical protein
VGSSASSGQGDTSTACCPRLARRTWRTERVRAWRMRTFLGAGS